MPTSDPKPDDSDWIAIGPFAQRAGVPASTLRYYEAEGLLRGGRSESGRRRYPRSTLRRVAFIRVAQSIGLTLDQIRAALATQPGERRRRQTGPGCRATGGRCSIRASPR
jgi:MerR family redox-sensitive transcriptional activator SoxR